MVRAGWSALDAVLKALPKERYLLHVATLRTAVAAVAAEARATKRKVSHVSLFKILFHFKALLWESIILLVAPLFLQRLPYCNTIARLLRNIRPPTDPPFVCHTLYSIGDGNIV